MSEPTTAGEKTFFGHPRGLSTLFFTEMWERLSYYGMRPLLILFMTATIADGGFGMETSIAGAIVGLYTFGVYALSLPGGWIADRLVGTKKAVLLGGIVIAAGHYTLAIPTETTFYLGLILVVVGTGLLKPNVSAIVGDLYSDKPAAQRDAGFSIFYMGINLGALIGPLVCGTLAEVNWHYGFGAAGVGMTFGLIQYVLGGRNLGTAGQLKEESDSPEALADAWRKFFIGAGVVVVITAGLIGIGSAFPGSITLEGFANSTAYIMVALAAAYFIFTILFACKDTIEKKRVGLIAVLFFGAAMFWSGFEQASTSFNIFARDQTNLVFFGWQMPVTWLQSINPTFIIILAPLTGLLWVKLGAKNPSIGVKFGLGLIIMALGFLVLAWGSTYTSEGRVSPMWLVSTYFLHTVGELCLSPVGLSSITKLSPKRLVGQMMGTWFLGAALGNLIAGIVGGKIKDLPQATLFMTVASIAIGTGLLFFVLSGPFKKLAAGVK